VDSPQGKEFSLTNEQLGRKLMDNKLGDLLDESDEKIEPVSYYTHPLNSWQIYKRVMHHAFIIFRTKSWWWSVEKNDAGVTIQRSKNIEHIRDKYHRNKRQENWMTRITGEKTKRVKNKTVKQFFEHIYEANYVNEEYHFLEKNCQEFADKIYDFF
jgi:hypothetical protein